MLENRYFVVLVVLFAVLGSMGLEYWEKGEEVLYFSVHRSGWWDGFFRVVTLFGEGYLFVLVGVWYLRRGERRVVVSIAVLGGLVSLISGLTKILFKEDRPYGYFQQLGQLDLLVPVPGVELHRGATSFPSGHTMAAFGLFSLLALVAREKRVMGIGMFVLALLVGISRIYLGQHFFRDIYAGGLAGIMIAIIVYWVGIKKK
jgi:membrane-associated phospholipid phosphatase